MHGLEHKAALRLRALAALHHHAVIRNHLLVARLAGTLRPVSVRSGQAGIKAVARACLVGEGYHLGLEGHTI